MRRLLWIPLLVLLVLPAPVRAQDDALLDLARRADEALRSGEKGRALELYQELVQKLQAAHGQEMALDLPAPLPGWTADPVQSQAWSGTGDGESQSMTHVSREYRRESDGAHLTITLTNWPQMVQATRAGLEGYRQMATLMGQDPQRSLHFREEGEWTVMTMVDHAEGRVEVQALGPRHLAGLELDTDDADTVDAYLKALDLARIH